MPSARWRSLVLVTATSTMRLPWTLPSRTMVAVLIMLSMSFWAVPAFSLVEPAEHLRTGHRGDGVVGRVEHRRVGVVGHAGGQRPRARERPR